MEGRQIGGRYSVERLAGKGGMGAVYRATDTTTGEPVALKVISGARVDAVERFEREAKVLATLAHPNIVRHIDHGQTEDGDPFLAMEWLEGEDVAGRLTRGPLHTDEAATLVSRTADALAEIHARGVVHRDIKPSNVFLRGGAAEAPVLLDFGIARQTDVTVLTQTGSVLGTPQYMSPEQVRGERALGPRSDVFSLGCLLYECLTGRPAFAGEHAMAVLAKVLLEEPARASELVPGVPRAVDRLLVAMLGKKADERPTAAEVAARLAQSDADLPASLVRPRILTGRERKLVSVVLASDAAATTTTGNDRTMTSDALAHLRARMAVAVERLGGQFSPLGSANVLVTVPPSGAAVDQATTAARCARVIADLVPGVTVSLAMGWAEIDPIPVGEVIDRAARMLSQGADGRIHVDDVSASLLELRFDVGGEGDARTLEAERSSAEPPRLLLGRPTPCVGRDRELGVLTGLATEVIDEGVARVAHVTAPAGVGKSRLRHEVTARIVREHPDAIVLVARAEAFRTHASLDMIGQILREAAGVGSGEEPNHAQAKLFERAKGAPTDHGPDDLAAFLGEIASIPFDDSASPRLASARRDNRVIGDLMLEAWRAWLGHEVTRHPVVLVLEDLHWSDAQTVKYIDVALRDLAERPLFVIALSRPEVHTRFPALWRDRSVQEIALPPLSTKAAERLVRAALAMSNTGDVERIVRQCEGNPLYIEEMIRAAASGRGDAAPGSVVAMMQSRLEALDANERRVLRAASIFGESFEIDDVSSVAGEDVGDILDRLVEREVMFRRRAGDSTLAFRHALVREAAYAMLTPDDQKSGHGLAAAALEARGATEAVVIAEHLDRAGEKARAGVWYVEAARQALRKTDFEAAIARTDAALERASDPDVRGAALALRGKGRSFQGMFVDAQRDIEEGLATAKNMPAETRIEHLDALWVVGTFLQDAGVLRRSGETARAIAETMGRRDLACEANVAIATAEHCEGACEAAVERLRGSVGGIRERPSPVVGLASLVLYHTGNYIEGEAVMAKMMIVARDAGDATSEIVITSNMGMCLAGQGRYAEARDCFERSRSIAAKFALTTLLARALSTSTGHALDVFDLDGTERRAHETQQVGGVIEFATPRVSASVDLAYVAVRRGKIDEAIAIIDKIGNTLVGGKGFHGWIWRIRLAVLAAEIFAARGDWELALAHAASSAEGCARFQRVKYQHLAENVRVRALVALGRTDEALGHARRVLEDARRFPDPAMLLRAATAVASITNDEGARAEVVAAATRIEGALPDARSKEAFRAGAELAGV